MGLLEEIFVKNIIASCCKNGGMKEMIEIMVGGGVLALASITELTIAKLLFNKTILRNGVNVEKTMKMAGTNWSKYMLGIKKKKAWLLKQENEVVSIKSNDGLKLVGRLFPRKNSKKVVICFHGYTSRGMSDYGSLATYYLNKDFNMLIIDERAHGDSEGKYIGFGCLDRYDALEWIKFAVDKFGNDCEILLHGISMGGATVLMTSGLDLPANVKAIFSDCGFTSAWEVFSNVIKDVYHIPPYPTINIASKMAKKYAGYEFDQCNSAEEVQKAKVPILLIHGDADTFVPCYMCNNIYDKCASEKDILIVKGAGHAEAYYAEQEAYEDKMNKFIDKYFS